MKITVRRVCEGRRGFETQKDDERESTGEFSEGMKIVGKVKSFVYEKCLGRLLVSFHIMTKYRKVPYKLMKERSQNRSFGLMLNMLTHGAPLGNICLNFARNINFNIFCQATI